MAVPVHVAGGHCARAPGGQAVRGVGPVGPGGVLEEHHALGHGGHGPVAGEGQVQVAVPVQVRRHHTGGARGGELQVGKVAPPVLGAPEEGAVNGVVVGPLPLLGEDHVLVPVPVQVA